MKREKAIEELKPALSQFYYLVQEGRITEDDFITDMSHRLEIILFKALDEQREGFVKKIKGKERVYEKEVRENNIEPASIQGEFHEQFLDGYNKALDDIIKKI